MDGVNSAGNAGKPVTDIRRARLVRFAMSVAGAAAILAVAAGFRNQAPRPLLAAAPPSAPVLQSMPDAMTAPLMLPALNFLGTVDICRSWVSIQNVGADDTTAVLVVWDTAPGGSVCQGPLKAECSGLIAPGSSWHFGPQVPSGSASGLVYSFAPGPLGGLGVTGLRADLAESFVCETLFFGTVGQCDNFAAFHRAYMSGGTFQGIPMDLVRGSALAGSVLRHCPADTIPGAEASASYQALPLVPSAMTAGSPTEFTATGFPIRVGSTGGRYANVQTAAPDGATIALSVRLAGSASAWSTCLEFDAFIGETTAVDLFTCTEPGSVYAVRASSAAPVAMTVDDASAGSLTSMESFYPGGPIDAVGRTVAGSAHRAFGPLVGVGGGFVATAAVHVPGSAPADVTVSWPGGGPPATQTRRICADCFETFVLQVDSAGALRSVQVESAGVDGAPAPRVDATLIVRNDDAAPAEAAYAYTLVPNSVANAMASGGALGMPAMFRSLTDVGVTSLTAVARADGMGGAVETTQHFFDVNDALAIDCIAVPPAGNAVWLAENSSLVNTSMGSAVLTAAPGSDASLAAANVQITGTDGPALPGDEVAVSLAATLVGLPGYTAWPSDPCADFAPVQRPAQVAPPERAVAVRAAVRLPIVAYQGQDDACTVTITVHNSSDNPMLAILATWSEGGFCPPQCAGPLHIGVSDVIDPDGTWDFTPVPGSSSGIVYGATALTMDDVGAIPGGSERAAEVLADALFLEAMGDCDDMRRFEVAWAGGGMFLDIPLGPLAMDDFTVDVARTCPDYYDPSSAVDSEYTGVSSDRFDTLSDATGRRVQSLTPIRVGRDVTTNLYVQNAGGRCTTVLVAWHAYGAWDQVTSCSVFWVSPGEVYPLDPSDCLPDGWRGSAVLESEEPLALLGEITVAGGSTIVAGRSRANPYDLDGDGDVDGTDVLILDAALGSQPDETHPAGRYSGPADARWNALADLDADGRVTMNDRLILVDNLDTGVVPPPAPTEIAGPPTPTPTQPAPDGDRIYLPYGSKR